MNLKGFDPINLFDFKDYLELVDWTGRVINTKKRGAIGVNAPPILERLNINPEQWIEQHPNIETNYPAFMGNLSALEKACATLKRKWIKGKHHSQLLFSG